MKKVFLISRTDSIGDVILTLPMAGLIKEKYPNSYIIFLARNYTKPVVDLCENIDLFLSWDEIESIGEGDQIERFKSFKIDTFIHVFPNKQIARLAKYAKIPNRIGTLHRSFHWFTCNKLLNFGRKNSNLHEAQLNIKLLKTMGITGEYPLSEIEKYYGFTGVKPLAKKFESLLDQEKYNLIIHPKSKGSAVEWGSENFSELIKLLPKDRVKIFISGTSEEGSMIKESLIDKHPDVCDITGIMNLDEFISFIAHADGLLAASTGPLHIAAALGKNAFGLFAPIRPIFPQRWAPIGKNIHVFVSKRNNNHQDAKKYISEIKVVDVKEEILKSFK